MGYKFHKASVLIVEDNQPMVTLIRSVIEKFGFKEVYTACDGEEGFDIFCEKNPDLIISDWMMSPTNGIEMAHKIRQSENSPNKFVPIILLTGFSQKQRVVEARDTGITEFLVKPFNVADLYKRIETIIEAPRQFIESDDFFGPDRRRKKTAEYSGPMRRNNDQKNHESAILNSEDKAFKKIMQEQKSIEETDNNNHDPLMINLIERDDD